MPKKYVLLLAVAGGILISDQLVKFAVLDSLTEAFEGKTSFGQKVGTLYSSAPAPAWVEGLHYRQKRTYVLSDHFLMLRYAENPGAAWGLFRQLPEGVRGPLFHVVSIGAVILILYYFAKLGDLGTGPPLAPGAGALRRFGWLLGTRRADRWALWGLPLVLGGALGNYMDRLARGFVIDFIEAHWFDKATWPSFNVADSAICVGVGMLVLDAIVRREPKPAKDKLSEEGGGTPARPG